MDTVVTLLAFRAPGLPAREELAERLDLRRLDVDRRITAAFRPLPPRMRRVDRPAPRVPAVGDVPAAVFAAWLGSRARPAAPGRRDRRAPAAGSVRGATPSSAAVPDADVYHCKALVALPVVAGAAARGGAAFAYDLADLHTEAARLARMPLPVRALVRRREAGWVRRASLLTAVSAGVAREAARRFHVPQPVVVLNCPPAWRPDEPAPPVSDLLREATGIAADAAHRAVPGRVQRRPRDRGADRRRRPGAAPAARRRRGAAWLREAPRPARRGGRATARGACSCSTPCRPAELLEWTASADVGYVGQPPRTLNQRLNLANKLFESIMAGVPVLVAEGGEHCRLVTSEALGRLLRRRARPRSPRRSPDSSTARPRSARRAARPLPHRRARALHVGAAAGGAGARLPGLRGGRRAGRGARAVARSRSRRTAGAEIWP